MAATPAAAAYWVLLCLCLARSAEAFIGTSCCRAVVAPAQHAGSQSLRMVLTTRNEAVTSVNTRVQTTIPNPNGESVMSTWQFKVLDQLFSIPLINAAMFGTYRKQMVTKAEGMGIPWTAFLEDLKSRLPELKAHQAALTDASTHIPEY
jgi:hypothetical protein